MISRDTVMTSRRPPGGRENMFQLSIGARVTNVNIGLQSTVNTRCRGNVTIQTCTAISRDTIPLLTDVYGHITAHDHFQNAAIHAGSVRWCSTRWLLDPHCTGPPRCVGGPRRVERLHSTVTQFMEASTVVNKISRPRHSMFPFPSRNLER